MTRLLTLMGILTALAAPALGCRGQVSEEPPIVPIRNMYDQPRYDPQERSEFFEDGRTMRPLVEGAVAREMEVDPTLSSGRTEDGSAWLLEIPGPVIERKGGMEALLARGHERHDIFCAPCHGLAGDGQGLVSTRVQQLGFSALAAPTLHDDRIRHMPDGQLYATITNGIRNMPAYAHSIPQDDRWAIVAYVRALQISQASRQTAMNVEGLQ
ncbi:MAG: cytochrome c [Myxococcales bacterium]|nr:cytochrome c [Myxococcales bacterium]